MAFLLVASLGYYGGKARQAKLQMDTIYDVTYNGCYYGAIKTQYDLKTQGVILPDINEEVYLGPEVAKATCEDFITRLRQLKN